MVTVTSATAHKEDRASPRNPKDVNEAERKKKFFITHKTQNSLTDVVTINVRSIIETINQVELKGTARVCPI